MNIDVLFDLFFADASFEDRLSRIAAAGFKGVETWKGGDADELKTVGRACRDNGLTLVSVVLNGPGDQAVAPIRADACAAFLERIDAYSDNALAAGCTAGIVTTGNRLGGQDYYEQKQHLIDALVQASRMAEKKGFLLNLEPLNDKVDHPGYFLTSREEAVDIARQVNSPHLRILYDFYHQQVMTGDHLAFVLSNIDWIGHFHAAGVPGRHEVFDGELAYSQIVRRLDDVQYNGWLGLEYKPTLDDKRSLEESLRHL